MTIDRNIQNLTQLVGLVESMHHHHLTDKVTRVSA